MKISEVVEKLNEVLKNNGDLEVECCMDTDPMEYSWQTSGVHVATLEDEDETVCVIC